MSPRNREPAQLDGPPRALEAGDSVRVFFDPITRNHLEGDAELLELDRHDEELDAERWAVSFADGPGAICFRWVHRRDLLEPFPSSSLEELLGAGPWRAEP